MKWTEQALRDVVAACTSYRQVAVKLGLSAKGGSYRTVQRWIRFLGLDISHFVVARGRSRRPGWSDDALREAIATSSSFAQVLTRLGVIPAGGNYQTLKRRIAALQLDTNHFTPSG